MYVPEFTNASYDDVSTANARKRKACVDFEHTLFNYLWTCLSNAGYINKRVRVKQSGVVGELSVQKRSHSYFYPYEITFHPITKSGTVSLQARYVRDFNYWKLRELPEMLKELFELVGEDNAD